MPDRSRSVVFLFAHQDDEYGAAPWIEQERQNGARVYCYYLTDGASRVPVEVRDAESRAVLCALGVAANDAVFESGRAPDLGLPSHAVVASERFEAWLSTIGPGVDAIYVPAWEGGHPDHDAAHAIGLLAAQRRGILESSWQFPLYNAYHCPRPFFRALSLLPRRHPEHAIKHNFSQAWRYAMLCWAYRSQRRTWIGLFPGSFFRRVFLRAESIAPLNAGRVMVRPHDGELLYERMFGTSYEQFSDAIAPLRRAISASER